MEGRRSRAGRSGGSGSARRTEGGAWGGGRRRRAPARAAVAISVSLLAALLVACPNTVAPPATITVDGVVLGIDGVPLAGVLVYAQGELTTTGADGAFRLEGITAPYTLTLGSGGTEGWVHAYEGLTATAPLLVPTGPALDGYTAGIQGALLGIGALPDDEIVSVGVEGTSAPVLGYGGATGSGASYGGVAFWRTPGTQAPARVHALRIQVDAQGSPLAYFGYDVRDVMLVDGAITTADVQLNLPVADARLEGTVTVASGGVATGTRVLARFGASYALPFYGGPAATVLSLPAPDVGDGSVVVVAEAGYPHGTTLAWTSVPVGPAFAFEAPTPPHLLAPAPNAAGVTAATEFRAEGGPAGGRLFVWYPVAASDGPRLALTTAADTARIPDVTPLGLTLVAGGRYEWRVHALAAENYEAATSVPAVYGAIFMFGALGAIPQDGAIASSTVRTMTLAP